jgi:hypothetical protein
MLGVTQFKNVVTFNNNKTDIDISFLPQGIYFIQFKSNDKIFVQKFIKQ